MIVFTCTNCGSKNIDFYDIDSENDTFVCEECNKTFTKQETAWEEE